MDVVEPPDSTEDLLRCAVLRWSTDNDVAYSNIEIVLYKKKTSGPLYDIENIQNIRSAVQVV